MTLQLHVTLLLFLLVVGATARRNVLFIAVDDMRPSIGAFNFSLAHTPNMDRLAANGLTFSRAYVQYAFCAPSRNSFMSGRRPDTTRVWNFHDHFREVGVGDQWRSMPEFFKDQGYITMGSGKLYHPTVPPDNDYPKSWSTDQRYYSPECMPRGGGKHCAHSTPPHGNVQVGGSSGPFTCLSRDPPGNDPPGKVKNSVNGSTLCVANTTKDEHRFDYQLEDQRIRDSCVDQLHVASKALKAPVSKNFFIACGFHKPHVPWVFPSEFLDYYPSDLNDIPLADDTYAPTGMPDVAWHPAADVLGMEESPSFNGTCNETRARNFRRGYYAAISYTDYNIGVLLDTLDELGLANDTVVAVMGDHGWQLGEHDTWAKMTNWEVAVRTPLIIRAPWKESSVGKVTRVLAEAVDLYPTFAALAGLPTPESLGEEINGTNLVPVFDDPEASHIALKPAAFSQFAKPFRSKPFEFWPTPARNATQIMGYTVRVDQWRYTSWFGFDGKKVVPKVNEILGRELYDHRGDPGELDWKGEHVNVVDDPTHRDVVASLHSKLLNYIRLYPVQ